MQTVDLRGVSCPTNFVKAKLALEMVDAGEVVTFLLDAGESTRNVRLSFTAEGHKIVSLEEKEGYSILTLEVSIPGCTSPEGLVREYPSTKITRSSREQATDPVMIEETVELMVNSNRLSSIVTTPELHKELAVGFMITEGAIRNRDDIEDIQEKGNRIYLTIRSFDQFKVWHEVRSSGCIGMNWENRDENLKVPVAQKFSIDILLESLKHLHDKTQDRTGGTHSASLLDSQGILRHKALDIGRHNAIDKIVGMAVLAGDDLSQFFMLSSGRQPAGMVMKAVRSGIPLVISKAAPISSGIDSALRSHLTLCCFADKEKIKVFSAPERVI